MDIKNNNGSKKAEMRIAVGVRFWGEKKEDISVIENFLDNALKTNVEKILVAINIDKDRTNAVEILIDEYPENRVNTFGVTPWGKFVLPCNALILKAAEEKATHLLTASTEVTLTQDIIDQLVSHMDNETLIVGAALPGHKLSESNQETTLVLDATGVEFPWGTYALWNLRYLQTTGICAIGDAPFDPTKAGVEEMVTLTILQKKIFPGTKIKLVEIDGIQWNTDFTGERLEKHIKKMESKAERPEAQFNFIGLKCRPTVIHIKKTS
ncbi:MAG: hypothetical protein Q7T34_02805 [Candidatus Parcubacteria bacterium]|nr:hypothetical protein [Candidatus Parcubacteria bacterium]